MELAPWYSPHSTNRSCPLDGRQSCRHTLHRHTLLLPRQRHDEFSLPASRAHQGSAYPFAFVTATPPDHVVTVEVIDKDSRTPLSKAFVTLHSSGGFPYRNHTDDAGVARVSVPKGEYRVYVLKEDYKDSQTTAAIASDVTIKAELLFAPDLGG